MLRYIIENKQIPPIDEICILLNKTKQRIRTVDFTNPYKEYNECDELFENILAIAIYKSDEKLANAQYVFKQYFLLFCDLMKYFALLKNKEYKASWNKLQDCIDIAQYIGRFSNDRLEIPLLLELLRNYEMLYPYKVFASSECIITKSHCSICGKSMQHIDCTHIKGNLYWGVPALKVLDEIKEVQAVCLVSHPEDKRCVVEVMDDKRNESERFKKLDQFLNLNIPFLQNFVLESVVDTKKKTIEKIGRNEPCLCGSGLKFKKCCGKELYYQDERNIVSPKETIELSDL